MKLTERVLWHRLLVDVMVMPECSCDHPVLETDPECFHHGVCS